MRFGFVTCVQLGLSCMRAIEEIGGRLDLAITLEDDQARSKSGRIYLDDFCADHRIPLHKARNVNHASVLDAVHDAGLDWLFIIGWSQIARKELLEAPRLGVIGAHPTLLPEGRGRAAIPWAILKGLSRTGVTLFKMDEGVDTGAILDQIEVPIGPQTDASELYAAVEAAHVALIKSAFPKLVAGDLEPRAQDENQATVWEGRRPDDGRIDLQGSVVAAERLVRATTRPYPGAFVEANGTRMIVWRVAIESAAAEPNAPRLRFPDGTLVVLDWETQPIA